MLFESWAYSSYGLLGQGLGHSLDASPVDHGTATDHASNAFPFFWGGFFWGGNHGGGMGGHATHPSTPSPTMVGSAGGLQFNLVWDPSVAHAPSGFRSAFIDAARYFTTLFSDDVVIKIRVGYGEVHGARLGRGDLGESENNGFLIDYATQVGALQGDSFPPSQATNAPTDAQFYITNAEAKALGLMGASTAVDGWIGLSSTAPLSYKGPATPRGQYDAIAIAEHEISEVMGRIGSEGEINDGASSYTALDLFNFESPGVLALSPQSGYFSVDNGESNLGAFNNGAANGGDIADWAGRSTGSSHTYDAFDAFTSPGRHGVVSSADVQTIAAVGYDLTSRGAAVA
jgi:hypothetical protein